MTCTQNRLFLTLLLAGLAVSTAPMATELAARPEPTLLFYHLDEASRQRTLLNDRIVPPRVRIGDAVVICFSAPQPGWVNLWSISPDGSFELIYPNDFSDHNGNGAKVVANEQNCIGEDERFRLRVSGDKGHSQVYLNWVTAEDALFAPEHFIDFYGQDGSSTSLSEAQTFRSVRTHDLGRADVYLSYSVVE